MKIKNIGKNPYMVSGNKAAIRIAPGETKEVPDASARHCLEHYPDDFSVPMTPASLPSGPPAPSAKELSELAKPDAKPAKSSKAS